MLYQRAALKKSYFHQSALKQYTASLPASCSASEPARRCRWAIAKSSPAGILDVFHIIIQPVTRGSQKALLPWLSHV